MSLKNKRTKVTVKVSYPNFRSHSGKVEQNWSLGKNFNLEWGSKGSNSTCISNWELQWNHFWIIKNNSE